MDDADSFYVGARACLMRNLLSPFFHLAHGCLERYFKGFLAASDSSFTQHRLRTKFSHDLERLLSATIEIDPMFDTPELRSFSRALSLEFEKGRYLVGADRQELSDPRHVERLGRLATFAAFDSLVCRIRNRVVSSMAMEECMQTILSQTYRAQLPQWRQPFVSQNEFDTCFDRL